MQKVSMDHVSTDLRGKPTEVALTLAPAEEAYTGSYSGCSPLGRSARGGVELFRLEFGEVPDLRITFAAKRRPCGLTAARKEIRRKGD